MVIAQLGYFLAVVPSTSGMLIRSFVHENHMFGGRGCEAYLSYSVPQAGLLHVPF